MSNATPQDFLWSEAPVFALDDAGEAIAAQLVEAAELAGFALAANTRSGKGEADLQSGAAARVREAFFVQTQAPFEAALDAVMAGQAVHAGWLRTLRATALPLFDAEIMPGLAGLSEDRCEKAAAGEPLPKTAELKKMVLRRADGAADIAMFGRMLADDPEFNRDAAVQESHALTTHQALVEDDFYTAVDDLKTASEDAGAGFVGDAGYGSGVYYLYACIDVGLLVENLEGDRDLAACAAAALAEAFAVSTPSGKRNSFAHQTRAGVIRAEAGAQQPRSLAGAFFKPIEGDDLMAGSADALTAMADQLDAAYGDCAEKTQQMNVAQRQGSLAEITEFVRGQVLHG
jgi:CRISPR-associated protein Cas7/Cse4/CasC subtype I-E